MAKYDDMKAREQRKRYYDYAIGIDTGVHTAIAIWDCNLKKFVHIETTMLHRALLFIYKFKETCEQNGEHFYVKIEDARQRKWFGERSQYKLQGAGSVKRDAKIWEDFLRDMKLDFDMVAPKQQMGFTKLTDAAFRRLTHYNGTTSEHARDAAMLVFSSTRTIPF